MLAQIGLQHRNSLFQLSYAPFQFIEIIEASLGLTLHRIDGVPIGHLAVGVASLIGVAWRHWTRVSMFGRQAPK